MVVLNIINDMMPEMDESFDVQILSVSDEGTIGDNSSCKQPRMLCTLFISLSLHLLVTVTIGASDDPNGRFRFSPSSLSVSVEEAGAVVNEENGMRYEPI